MPELYHALYYSRALVPDTPQQHNAILTASQRNNAAAHITGFLHREECFFLQYLEGPKTLLSERLRVIGQDTRHSNFEIILFAPLKHRMLADWNMGFSDPRQLSLGALLDTSADKLEIKSLDPFDLVVFLAHNSENLRDRQAA